MKSHVVNKLQHKQLNAGGMYKSRSCECKVAKKCCVVHGTKREFGIQHRLVE